MELAQAGHRVLRLKGGDPFVFGRGGEEAQTLVQHGVPIRVVPGITAGIGGLAYAGIPATHRDVNQAITFVTGHDQAGKTPATLDWQAIARGSQVIVIYMGMKHAAHIAAALMAAGRAADEPCAVITSATTPRQQVLETKLAGMADDIAGSGAGAAGDPVRRAGGADAPGARLAGDGRGRGPAQPRPAGPRSPGRGVMTSAKHAFVAVRHTVTPSY